MQSHSRRRKAFGLAALSLGTAGAVLGQAADAPGTAKEPRPASSFRLKANTIGGFMVKNGTLTLKDFKSRQVYSHKAGRRLARQLPPLAARIADTYTKAQADAAFLTKAGAGGLLSKDEANQTFLTQSAAAPFLTEAEADALFLTPAEADAAYARKADAVAGKGSVFGGTALVPEGRAGVKILDIPGIGELRGAGPSETDTTFLAEVVTGSATPIMVNVSAGRGATTTAGDPYAIAIESGEAVTLQMVAPGGQIVSLILSAQGGNSLRMTAQGLVTTP